jgi:hypothetical protein
MADGWLIVWVPGVVFPATLIRSALPRIKLVGGLTPGRPRACGRGSR